MKALNYAHNLLQQSKTLNVAYPEGTVVTDAMAVKKFVYGLLENVKEGVVFTIPDDGIFIEKGKTIVDNLRLPFDNIVLELNIKGVKTVINAIQASERVIQFSHWRKQGNQWGLSCASMEIAVGDPDFPAIMEYQKDGTLTFENMLCSCNIGNGLEADLVIVKHELAELVEILMNFLEILYCDNVEISDSKHIKPKKGHRLAAVPTKCTKVLHIKHGRTPSSVLKSEIESDRRTPREHLRRGHIHRFKTKTGYVRHWINAIIVNPGVGGAIDKSYAIT